MSKKRGGLTLWGGSPMIRRVVVPRFTSSQKEAPCGTSQPQARRDRNGRARRPAVGSPLRPCPAEGRGQTVARPGRRQAPSARRHPGDGAVGVARSQGDAEAHRRLRRRRVGGDDDALARQGPGRHHDGRDRRAQEGQPGRRTALGDGADLRQWRRAGRRDGDPHPQDRAQELRHQLQPARQGLPHHRRPRLRDARRLHQVLHAQPRASPRWSSSPA